MPIIQVEGILSHAKNIEDILCLAVLIASGQLPADSTITDAKHFFNSIDEECCDCPFHNRCLACIINE